MSVVRYSEPYQPTGGLAAEGVINQLGRPDIEPLEILVREAVQNCWDARRESEPSIRVEIGRLTLDADLVRSVATELLVDPPPDLPLADALQPGMKVLYFSDFGTGGLGGPTRADRFAGDEPRDFIDFVRNIGQPPDKDFGGGSFGYGKAAFYIASAARTIVVDTLCKTANGLERRVMGAALGSNHIQDGRSYTGRHWWGAMVDGVVEPLTGADAERAASLLGLPDRQGAPGLGTTIAVVAPCIEPDGGSGSVMEFIAQAVVWNFWPKMVSTKGGVQSTIDFVLTEDGRRVVLPDPRTHPRLRGFVEAMDRIRTDPADAEPDDIGVIDVPISSGSPAQLLGRLVIQKGPAAPISIENDHAVPQGMRVTANGIHHVALMRNAELVVRYLPGAEPATGRFGYSGVFRCSLMTDQAFRNAEPPTHDDWIARAVSDQRERRFVNAALRRIRQTCREAAGYGTTVAAPTASADVALGEFADGLARLMPGFSGPGARSQKTTPRKRRRRRNSPGARPSGDSDRLDVWVEGVPAVDSDRTAMDGAPVTVVPVGQGSSPAVSRPKPVLRAPKDPTPAISADGRPVMRYPFELRAKGNRVRLRAGLQVMTHDGESVEKEPPRGWIAPEVLAWVDSDGRSYGQPVLDLDPDRADGSWTVEVPIVEDMVIAVDITSEVIE